MDAAASGLASSAQIAAAKRRGSIDRSSNRVLTLPSGAGADGTVMIVRGRRSASGSDLRRTVTVLLQTNRGGESRSHL
jgi:hypothetical protein